MCVGCFFGVKEMSLGEASWASIFWKYDAYFFGSVGGRLYGEHIFCWCVKRVYVCDLCVSCVYSAYIKGLRLYISSVILEVDERHDSCA